MTKSEAFTWPENFGGIVNGLESKGKRAVFCVPTIKRPYAQTLDSLAASAPVLTDAGWDHYLVSHIGCPYISAARSLMLRKALDAKADAIVFIDHDLSWEPHALLTLLETEGDVVAGTYRFKTDTEEYMGGLFGGPHGKPMVRDTDGAVAAFCAPAGFLKVTRKAVNRFIEAYPELCYGDRSSPHVDLFNHGAHKQVWYGEDYAFCRNWIDAGGELWIVPDLNITHHGADGTAYPGNFHEYLLRRPGGSKSDTPEQPKASHAL